MTDLSRQSEYYPFTVHNKILGSGMLHESILPSYRGPLRFETIRPREVQGCKPRTNKSNGTSQWNICVFQVGFVPTGGTFFESENQPIGIEWALCLNLAAQYPHLSNFSAQQGMPLARRSFLYHFLFFTSALTYIMITHVHRVHGIGSQVSHRSLKFTINFPHQQIH